MRMQTYKVMRSPIKRTPLGYERTWKHEFTVEEFRVTNVPPMWFPPTPCEEHKPYCFLAKVTAPLTYNGGLWKQITPFKVKIEMPGERPTLTEIKAAAMHRPFGVCDGGGKIVIYVKSEGEEEFRKVGEYDNPHADGKFKNNTITLGIDLTGKEEFMIGVLQWAKAFPPWGSLERHDAGWDGNSGIVLTGKYYTVEPPRTADVEVIVVDKISRNPIRGAYVTLEKEGVAYYEGYTDEDGRVFFDDVVEDCYDLHVIASGYKEYMGALDVKPPKVLKTVELIKAPAPPPPPWARYVKYGLIGAGVGSGAGLAYAFFTGKPIKQNVTYGAVAGALAGAALSYVFGWE